MKYLMIGTCMLLAANVAMGQSALREPETDALSVLNPRLTEPVYSILQTPAAAGAIPNGYNPGVKTASPFAVINGSGFINFIPKFTPSGIEIGNSQIYDNGTLVGVGTSSVSYKLDVLSSTFQIMRLRVNGTTAIVDIDATTGGNTGFRLWNSGVSQWHLHNISVANDFEITEQGIGPRFTVQNNTGNVGIGINIPTAKLHVNGTITSTGAKAFTIDHPLDPENKMLHHFAIESNEVLNSYSGNAVTNGKGTAVVELPDYFEAINKDFRYQLTVIGSFAQAIISSEIKGNRFEIATSKPNTKVSWEVKARRNDVYMQRKHAMPAEEIKPAAMKGKYFDPEVYGQPETKGVNYRESAGDDPAVAPKMVADDITGRPASGSKTAAPPVRRGR